MSMWKKGLMVAFEDHSEVKNKVFGGADTAESDILKLQSVSVEMMKYDAALEQAVSSALDMQRIADCFSGQSSSKAAAKIATISTESIYNRVGITKKQVPSLESFKTGVATEGILDAARMVWEKIKQAIKDVFKWIGEFFKSLFSSNKKLADTSKEVLKKIEKMEKDNGNKPKTSTELLHGALAKELTIDGKFDVVTMIKSLKELSEFIVSSNQTILTLSGIIKPINFQKEEPIDFKDIEDKLKKVFQMMPINKQILGSRMLVAQGDDDNPLKVSIAPFNGQPYKELDKIPVTDTDKLKQIIRACDDISTVIENGERLQKDLEEFYKKLEEDINKLSKDKPDDQDLPKLLKLFTNMNTSVVSTSKCVYETSTLINKAARDYVEKCMEIYVKV